MIHMYCASHSKLYKQHQTGLFGLHHNIIMEWIDSMNKGSTWAHPYKKSAQLFSKYHNDPHAIIIIEDIHLVIITLYLRASGYIILYTKFLI